jgi:hypothetical protein
VKPEVSASSAAQLVVAVVALVLIAACGGADDSRISPQEALTEPCRLLAVDEVEEVLGTPVTVTRERLAVGAIKRRGCEYAFEDDDADAGSSYGLVETGWRPKASIVAMSRAEADRALGRPASAFEQVGGLGDEAFFVPPHESLLVRIRGVVLVVDVGNYLHAHGSPAAHEKLRADTRELAETALARLG